MRRAALLAAAVLAGCGLLPGAQPDWVANRQPLPACGEEVPGQLQEGHLEMRTCLLDAYRQGEPAELITTESTLEGDPITRYIRVHENGVIEIFVDATRDRYGSGEWELLRCEALISVEEANERPGFGLQPESVFFADMCEKGAVP